MCFKEDRKHKSRGERSVFCNCFKPRCFFEVLYQVPLAILDKMILRQLVVLFRLGAV